VTSSTPSTTTTPPPAPATGGRLMQGSEAVTEAAIAAGCRFFAGYPMLPFTELLETMARRLPEVGGTCMNAESEIEGVNMVLGAAAAGARAGTGSCGQGIALMQEAIAEAALNEVPFVVFNMARGQQDYFQCTRGGGWGDYRTITLAPKDVVEAVEHTQLLFHLADLYRSPVVMYGDYLVAHTYMSVDVTRREYGPLPAKDWALDGSLGGTGRSRQIWTWRMGKATDPGVGPDRHWRAVGEKFADIARTEARHETFRADDAEVLVVSFGSSGPFVDHVVEELRADGLRVGSFRPVTLWPFPEDALAELVASGPCQQVLVFEVNAGQMIEDVRLSVGRGTQVVPIGGVSVDDSGMRQGSLLTVEAIRQRVLDAAATRGVTTT
jgi:2-oxoglutarate/2-oxoacid ferredoxin oxidoreductase subunit alpha